MIFIMILNTVTANSSMCYAVHMFYAKHCHPVIPSFSYISYPHSCLCMCEVILIFIKINQNNADFLISTLPVD